MNVFYSTSACCEIASQRVGLVCWARVPLWHISSSSCGASLQAGLPRTLWSSSSGTEWVSPSVIYLEFFLLFACSPLKLMLTYSKYLGRKLKSDKSEAPTTQFCSLFGPLLVRLVTGTGTKQGKWASSGIHRLTCKGAHGLFLPIHHPPCHASSTPATRALIPPPFLSPSSWNTIQFTFSLVYWVLSSPSC